MATDHTPDVARPLAGYRVLVTRPAGRAAALAARLRRDGAAVVEAPLLDIELLPDTPEALTAAQDLDRYDIVVVTSRHAVESFLPVVSQRWPQWPAAQAWLAVGAGTAEALAAHGIAAAVPARPDSEGLLALAPLQDVAGRRVLLVAGEGGRALLAETLAARGAQVTRLATYRRRPRAQALDALDAFRDSVAAPGHRIALVTSVEALQNLLALAPWLPVSDVAVLVASARIAEAAHGAGLRRVIVAVGAGDDEQRDALLRLARTDEDCA